MNRCPRPSGRLFIILSAAAFGTMPLFGAIALAGGMSSLMLALLRHALLIPVFAAIILLTPGMTFRISRRQLGSLLALALFGALITAGLLYASYRYIDTGIATALNFTYPVFVLLLGAAIYREPVTGRTVGCLVLCMAGVVLLCAAPVSRFSWAGLFMALGSGAAYAVYTLYLDKSRLMEQLPLTVVTFYFFLLSSVLLGLAVLVSGGLRFPATPQVLGSTALFCLCGLAATVCFQLGVRHAGSRQAALLSCIEPAVSVLLGAAFLKEPLNPAKIAGILLILAATGISARHTNS